MKNSISIISIAIVLCLGCWSCQQGCVNTILLETTDIDVRVNSENLGIVNSAPQNTEDTIKSLTNQFYDYPTFRQFGHILRPSAPGLITSAYANDGCPEQQEYISRFDVSKTMFSVNKTYDATHLGIGILPADTNLLSVDPIKDNYLSAFTTNSFFNAGAPAPLSLDPDFFTPLNDQHVVFRFKFEEEDGTIFTDSVSAYVSVIQ